MATPEEGAVAATNAADQTRLEPGRQPSFVRPNPPLQRSPQRSFIDAIAGPPPQQRSPQQSTSQGWSPQESSAQGTVPDASDASLPPVRLRSALKTQDQSAAPLEKEPARTATAAAGGAGKELCHNPVGARTAKAMIGAQVERSTGITYPYNLWGPCNPTRFGSVAEMPPDRGQKCNYQGQQETLMKDRLESRDFGHVRHNCYRKNPVEPTGVESLAFMDPNHKEFWRTDVDRVLKKEEEDRRARQKEILGIMANEEAWRRQSAQKMRDMKYQAYLDLSETMQKVGNRTNRSGAPHINIITREPIGEHNIKAAKFRDDCSEYKKVQRTRLLRQRNTGAGNYNILNWTQNPPGPELPPWPEKPSTPPPPPPPDPRIQALNSSKGAISCGHLFGALGKFNT